MGDPPLSSFCPNCGAPREDGALFCARCGRNFTEEFKGTAIEDLKGASEILLQLRAAIGDRYVIERELGKGGMATVFLARDSKHDREVAIKVLHPELSASIGADRFDREIRVAAKLQHPHILGLYDSGSADGLLYYVMPFVRGESLRDKLDREGMLPVDEALRITLEVCSALNYAHEQGIVHRDIKPENILLSGDHALIADFGIARAANDGGAQKLTQTGMAVGTPVYMAPEQSTGDPVGPSADIYSLGCMLYEMLAGEPPFTGANAMAIMAKHLMEQVPSVRVVRNTVPEQVEEAIFHALAKAPVDRPKTAQAFADMLGMSLSDSAVMRAMRPSSAMRRVTPARATMSQRGSQMLQRQTTAGMVFKVDETGELVEIAPVAWWKRPATLAIVAGVAALGIGGAWFASTFGGPKLDDPTAKRVAVLYFDDLSRDSSLAAAATGITEGMIRSLSTIGAITTISRSGSESVRGIGDRDSISSTLKVSYLVQGDLEPVRDSVRINYRLVHKSGDRLGSGALTVARDHLANIQDSVSALAANLIRAQLGPEIKLAEQRAGTSSNDAWLAVQEGAQIQRQADRAQGPALGRGEDPTATPLFDGADSVYAVAEKLDPKWVEPTVRRTALSYRRSRLRPRQPAEVRPWVEKGLALADAALAKEPRNPDALELRGTLRYWGFLSNLYEGKDSVALKQAQTDLELSTQVNPAQAGAWATLSAAYYQVPGKGLSDVMFAAQKALDADEFQQNVIVIRGRLANAAYDNGDFERADTFCRELETRYPGNPRSIRCRLYLQSVPGLATYDIARAWRLTDSLVHAPAAGDTVLQRLIGNVFTAATIARAAKKPNAPAALADSARAVAARSLGNAQIDQQRETALFAAMVSTVLGDKDDAISRLTTYIAVNPGVRAKQYRTDPGWWFRSLSDSPEWQRMVGAP